MAQGNIGFVKADVGNTHPVKVEAQRDAIIDGTAALIPNSTPVLIEGLHFPHPGVLVHDFIATVKNNIVQVPVSIFSKRDKT